MTRWALVLLLCFTAQPAADLPVPSRIQQHGKASLWVNRPANDLSVKISQTLKVYLRVEGEAPVEVELTEKLRSTAGWRLEFLDKPTLTTIENSTAARWEQAFLATPLQLGLQPLQLPALQFTEKGGPEQTVAWEPLKVEVTTSVAKVDISEIRDRSGIEELPPLPEPKPWWPWLFLLLPIPLAVAFVAWRRRARPISQAQPSLTALGELDALGRSTPSDAKQFYTSLSDILRRYLERRFRLPATRWTTSEFTAAFAKSHPQNGVSPQLLNDILLKCDLAKFAEMNLDCEDCEQFIASAREFINHADKTAAELASRPQAEKPAKAGTLT